MVKTAFNLRFWLCSCKGVIITVIVILIVVLMNRVFKGENMNTKRMNINQKTVRVHMKGDGKARGFSRTLLILYCAVIAFPIIFVV